LRDHPALPDRPRIAATHNQKNLSARRSRHHGSRGIFSRDPALALQQRDGFRMFPRAPSSLIPALAAAIALYCAHVALALA
jgi:hypothetical protein